MMFFSFQEEKNKSGSIIPRDKQITFWQLYRTPFVKGHKIKATGIQSPSSNARRKEDLYRSIFSLLIFHLLLPDLMLLINARHNRYVEKNKGTRERGLEHVTMKEEGNDRKVEHLDDITRSSGQQVLIAAMIYRASKFETGSREWLHRLITMVGA